MTTRLDLERKTAAAVERVWPRIYGHREGLGSALEIVERCVAPPPTGWRSLISDDHAPVELSVAHRDVGPELRLLFEIPGTGPTPSAQYRAALGQLPWLRERFGARLDRFERIAAELEPDDVHGRFGIWLAAVFRRDGTVDFKAYLDPQAKGPARAADLVERALEALSLPHAWTEVAELARRGPALDVLSFLSLDLVDVERARTKVYVSKHNATFEDLRFDASLATDADPDWLAAHVAAVTDADDGVLCAERPTVTCLAFLGHDPRPRQLTVHVPVRAYAPDDAVARERVMRALRTAGYPIETMERVLDAFAERPLEAGSGLIPYISHGAAPRRHRVTVYLATEAFATHPPHAGVVPTAAPVTPPGNAPEAVRHYAQTPITFHPYLQRLAREPLAMERLALLLLNFQRAITRDFSRRLAQTVARVDDDAVRSILAKQLNDELGDGDPDAAHRLLFDRFVDGMRPYAPVPPPADVLAPGERLGQTLEALYVDEPDPWIGVGATLMMEVFGQQVDSFLGDQFRRQSELPPPVMEWQTLHEELEHDHVDEVFDLAERVPDGVATRQVLDGVQALATAGWRFFDDMYARAWPG